jgi:hypothetical protein
MLPDTTVLNNARKSFLYGTLNHQAGQYANYSAPSTTTYNGSNASNFYTIFPIQAPAGSDNKVHIGVDVQAWRRYNSGTISTTWDGVASGTYKVTNGATQSDTSAPGGIRIFESKDIAYNQFEQGASGAYYGFTKFYIPNVAVASFSSFPMPRPTATYQADDDDYSQQFHMRSDIFYVNTPLMGCSEYTSSNGSGGAICNYQSTSEDKTTSLVSATSPCIFQWSHPAGMLIGGAGAGLAMADMFGQPYINGSLRDVEQKARGRNLDSGATKRLDIAVVALWDTNTGIQVTASNGTSSGTLAFSAGAGGSASNVAVPALVVFPDALTYDPDGDTIFFEANVSTTAKVEIQTIALFERSSGVDV